MIKQYEKTKKLSSFSFFFGSLLFCCLNANAQTTKISVANGDWFNPATWSPAGVPSPISPTDSLIINSQVTFNQVLDARGVANLAFKVNSGASLTGTSVTDTLVLGVVDLILNYGTISVNSTIALGDITIQTRNYGQITANTIAQSDDFHNKATGYIHVLSKLATSDNFTNYGQIKTDTLAQTGNFINMLNGIIVVPAYFISNDNLTNNGHISADYWTNAGATSGSTGKFCITNCFINTDNITGTVDICDSSPGGFCDVNAGSIASSVTYCTSGPCITNVFVNEIANNSKTNLFPNPVADLLTIHSENTINEIKIYNSIAKIIYEEKTEPGSVYSRQVKCEGFEKGIYFVEIRSGQETIRKKLIIE